MRNFVICHVEREYHILSKKYFTGVTCIFRDMKDRCNTLNPGEVAMYTWQNPIGKRELVWTYGGKTFSDELVKVQ
jgi:hypothetical protein